MERVFRVCPVVIHRREPQGGEGASRGRWHVSVEDDLIKRGHGNDQRLETQRVYIKKTYFARYARMKDKDTTKGLMLMTWHLGRTSSGKGGGVDLSLTGLTGWATRVRLILSVRLGYSTRYSRGGAGN